MVARGSTAGYRHSALLTAWLAISTVAAALAALDLLLIELGVQAAPLPEARLPHQSLALLMGAGTVFLVALLRRRRWGLYGLALVAVANSLVYWRTLGSPAMVAVAAGWFIVYGVLCWREAHSRASAERRPNGHAD